MIALTQSLTGCGITGIIPIGVVTARIFYYSSHDKPGTTDSINEALAKVCPEADFVLNLKVELTPAGHASHGQFNAWLTGDAYKIVDPLDYAIKKADL